MRYSVSFTMFYVERSKFLYNRNVVYLRTPENNVVVSDSFIAGHPITALSYRH